MTPRSNNWDCFNFVLAMGDDEHVHWCACCQYCLVKLSRPTTAMVSKAMCQKNYKSSVDWRCIVQGTICRGPQQLRLCIACTEYATDIELQCSHLCHWWADMAASEGSPHNVLHSSSVHVYRHRKTKQEGRERHNSMVSWGTASRCWRLYSFLHAV